MPQENSALKGLFTIAAVCLFGVAMFSQSSGPQVVFASDQERITQWRILGIPSNTRVVAFVTDWCPACKNLEYSLEAANVRFARINIEESQAGGQFFEKLVNVSGSRGIPKVMVDRDLVPPSVEVIKTKLE